MLENSNLEEIEIQEGEESVRLVKSHGSLQSTQPQSIVLPQEAKPEVTEQEIESPEATTRDSNNNRTTHNCSFPVSLRTSRAAGNREGMRTR